MNKNIKVIGTKNTDIGNNVTIRIAVKDYFPDYNSGIEYFDVGLEAYNDLCQYKELMSSLVSDNDEDAVKDRCQEILRIDEDMVNESLGFEK